MQSRIPHSFAFITLAIAGVGCGKPAALDGDTLLGHLASVGTWMEVARYHTGTFTCEGCTEVNRWDFTGDDHAVELDITVFQHEPAAGGVAGAETCHMSATYTAEDADGVDARKRAITLAHTNSDDCFGQPSDFEQAWQVASVDDSARPLIVANWAIEKPAADFPGWFADKGHGGFPIAPCAEADHVDGRDYCDPGCDVGGDGATPCRYPDVPPLWAVP